MNLYKFYWDCGRMGDLEGHFISTDEEIKDIIGKGVYFGEVLGKHSEIYGTIKKEDFKVVSDDEYFCSEFLKIFPYGVGYNPLNYLEEEE